MHILIIFPFLFSAHCKANRNYTEYKPKSIARHPSFPGKIILPQDYFSYRHYTENEKLIFGIERASKYGSGPAEKKIMGISVCKFGEEKAVWFVRDDIQMGSQFKKILYGVEPVKKISKK